MQIRQRLVSFHRGLQSCSPLAVPHWKLCARSKDCRSSGFIEEVIILRRDDPATDNEHVRPAHVGQALDQGWYQGLVAGSEGGNSNNVHITVDSLLCNLLRGLEQWTDVDVKTKVRESCSNHLCSSIMTVLTHLGNQDPGPPPLFLSKALNCLSDRLDLIGLPVLGPVCTRHHLVTGDVPPVHCLHGPRDLTHGATRSSCSYGKLQKVALA